MHALAPLLAAAQEHLGPPPALDALERALAAVDAEALGPALRAGLVSLAPGARWVGDDLLVVPGGRVSLFLIPACGGIPLHDHPGMDVLLRVVAGRLRLRALDRVDPVAGLARPAGERVLGPEDGVVAGGPVAGNLHAVEALGPCAFIDVLAPDYAPGRPCRYYAEMPAPGGLVRLVERRP